MRTICFVSGKGGTGKTTVACNLAFALADEGQKVLLFDADFGLSNVETVAGVDVPCTLGHVVRDGRELKDALATTKSGFDVIAGGTGFDELAGIEKAKAVELLGALRQVAEHYDFLLIDGGPGLGTVVQEAILVSSEAVIVTTPDPTALTDAYAVAKTAKRIHPDVEIAFVVNRAGNEAHGDRVAKSLQSVIGQFLNVQARYLGAVREDKSVWFCLTNGELVTQKQAKNGASQDLFDVAYRLMGREDEVEGELSVLDRIKAVFGQGGDSEEELDEAA